ncbi:pseudouridine synthase [Anabaena sp. CCY 9910]|uniref:RluA family pseudouridine synthase n=1 Tax=Anabaena sp. CCY 9910 TaxID=3103870 RepID=UPI0039E0937C
MPFTEVLHPLSDFIEYDLTDDDLSANYWYEGYCLQSGDLLRLPRTALVETIAHSLMQCLAKDERYSREGKMYGILLVELTTGERRVLKAFSGLLNGQNVFDGWVPPIPGREQVAIQEEHTLAELDAIKQELITLKQLPQRQEYETLFQEFEQQLQAMSDRHRYRKSQRQQQRQLIDETISPATLTTTLEQLDEESRQDGIERRRLKQERDTVLQPLQEAIASANIKIQHLKQKRKALSRQLQAQMHAAYSLMNFLGQSVSLQRLMPNGLPTGTGDCCAPKLLHYAATHGLKPLAMAEFWWGSSCQDKIQGEFYGACMERCQPLMGFLLSGLKPDSNFDKEQINVIYEDEWLIAVNKPAGLLSVPGRYFDTQDSVLSRLRRLLTQETKLAAVHRLDQDTSGILLLARDRQTYRQLSQQFQQRQVHKVYEAILAGVVSTETGIIDLPLWGDPENRPYQQVDWQRGKPSVTNFRAIAREGDYTRVEFVPLTGRTHQLRVHASDVQGLGVVILGDRFYGCTAKANRLHLHARELCFLHPHSGKIIHLQVKTPF